MIIHYHVDVRIVREVKIRKHPSRGAVQFKSEAFADTRVIKTTKITASWWFRAPALAGRMYLFPPQYPSINNNDFSTNMGKSTFLAFS